MQLKLFTILTQLPLRCLIHFLSSYIFHQIFHSAIIFPFLAVQSNIYHKIIILYVKYNLRGRENTGL